MRKSDNVKYVFLISEIFLGAFDHELVSDYGHCVVVFFGGGFLFIGHLFVILGEKKIVEHIRLSVFPCVVQLFER